MKISLAHLSRTQTVLCWHYQINSLSVLNIIKVITFQWQLQHLQIWLQMYAWLSMHLQVNTYQVL